jgi:hypothetical protein
MGIFNFIIGPFIMTLLTDSNCFVSYFQGEKQISISFTNYIPSFYFSIKVEHGILVGSLHTYQLAQGFDVAFDPPFIYHDQCFNAFAVYYIPVLTLSFCAMIVISLFYILTDLVKLDEIILNNNAIKSLLQLTDDAVAEIKHANETIHNLVEESQSYISSKITRRDSNGDSTRGSKHRSRLRSFLFSGSTTDTNDVEQKIQRDSCLSSAQSSISGLRPTVDRLPSFTLTDAKSFTERIFRRSSVQDEVVNPIINDTFTIKRESSFFQEEHIESIIGSHAIQKELIRNHVPYLNTQVSCTIIINAVILLCFGLVSPVLGNSIYL